MFDKLSFQNQVNVVGGGLFVIIAGYFAVSLGQSREPAPCSSRYATAVMMSLQRPSDSMPMSPPELQARVGRGERGIVEKANVVRVNGAPSPVVLDVKVGGGQDQDTGVSFAWQPPGVAKASAACLSYNVKLPEDFDLSSGGILPGLFGELATAGGPGGQTGFSTRMAWQSGGGLGAHINLSDTNSINQGADPDYLPARDTSMPLGRWVAVEQEIILNRLNANDGVLRLWVDGRLKAELRTLAWRGHGAIRFGGAVSDISYISSRSSTDKKLSNIRLSPLRLAWE
jgi:hypothetical protein